MERRLLRYSAAAGLAMAAGLVLPPGLALADDIIVDDPDVPMNVANDGFYLDFDQDGFAEFVLGQSTGPTSSVFVTARNQGGGETMATMCEEPSVQVDLLPLR